MANILDYIRSLLNPKKRKRCCTAGDLVDSFEPKQRKLSLTATSGSSRSPEVEWLSTKKINFPRARTANLMNSTPIVLDDDVLDGRAPPGGVRLSDPPASSTPNLNPFNVLGIHNRSNYSHHQPVSISPKHQQQRNGASFLNRSKFQTPNVSGRSMYFTPMRTTPKPASKPVNLAGDTMHKLTYNLDEKRKYMELLNRAHLGTSSNGLAESFADYYTPPTRLPLLTRFSGGRSKETLGSTSSSHAFVDLTGNHVNTGARPKITRTSSTILKVLDELNGDAEPIVIKDSDSDSVEILPTPPEPKPDFKVERVNNLKRLVDSELVVAHGMDDRIREHGEHMSRMKSELAVRKSTLVEMSKINEMMQRQQLHDQVERCMRIKEVVLSVAPAKQPLPTLTAKQEEIVRNALDKRANPGAILSSKFNLHLARRDIMTLAGLNWLNDEIINFYMNLLIERGKLERFPNCYAFNTFFYQKISKDGQAGVRRWTRRIDLFAHDIICVPIHLGMHWCMAIVDFRAKTVNYYDSMGKPNQLCLELIFKYLQDEHRDKKDGAVFDTTGWRLVNVKGVPQQMNGSDCGVFSCMYAEFASRNAPFDFSQDEMPYFRRKMVVEIMTANLLIQ